MSIQENLFSSGRDEQHRGGELPGSQASVLRTTLEQLTSLLSTNRAAAGSDDLTDAGKLQPILYLNWRSAVSDQQGSGFIASNSSGGILICEGTPEQPGTLLWHAPSGPVKAPPAAPPAKPRVPVAAKAPAEPVAPPAQSRQPLPSGQSPSPSQSIGTAQRARVRKEKEKKEEVKSTLQPQAQEVYITAPSSGKRLAMDETRAGAGARLVMQDSHGGDQQRFTLTPQPHGAGFLLSAANAPLTINAALGRRNHGWQLIEMGRHGGSAEPVFAVEPTAEGDFRIRAPQSGRWLAIANVTGTEMPVLDASVGEEQASRWQITVAPPTPRLALLDLMSVAPRPKTAGELDLIVKPGQIGAIDALVPGAFRAFSGDFLKRGRDQLMLVRIEGRFHHIDLLDFANGEVVASAVVEPGGWIDDWLGANDVQLVGDLAGIGASQLLLLHRGQRRPGEHAVLYGLDGGLETPTKHFADSFGEQPWLDGWLDIEDVHLTGDFMGLGYDQWMMLNRNPRGGRVRIVDIKSGTPRRCYTEMWGQSPLLNGWTEQGRQMLVGDFLKRGHAQVLFINRHVTTNNGKMLIADFCRAAPPAEVGYREAWGQSSLHNEFLADGDVAVAGDFMGRGHAQVLFMSRKGYGEKFLVADFHSGAPPVEACLREAWGQRGSESRHEARIGLQSTVVAGRFRAAADASSAPSQLILI